MAEINADPALRRSYAAARRLNAEHGRTYYLATLLLPAWKRPYVHALYGFARYADDIVDSLDSQLPAAERARWLADWGGRLVDALRRGTDDTGGTGGTGGYDALERPLYQADVSVLPAVIHTIRRWNLQVSHFEAFLASMAMDLTVTGYDTFDDLMTYVYGSGSVIGLQMLPILEPSSPAAAPYAGDLGTAFQLINFIRDVGEDLRRGRVYLPRESMELFGVTRERLASGVVDGAVRRLLRHEIGRARELLHAATPGIRLLHPTSRDCVWTAARLYGGILGEVERADYQVLHRRVAVGTPRRIAVAGGALLRSQARRLAPTPR
ncbi:phytoene/squalene synthase family protein [Frankia sp. CNm7]|uniref:Phytoene/squalene synthase family protein n=1 Tax=Frankia nepalensis TaxID=1836974 RepID=A0A937RCU8_9ACTN|nr:phytoene/squalene synthase family protein [Frankia nepalensis]MBL7516122.1 phytoene/squalene synthase family protein [Frankia nepalensis]MBL7518753.1 phytoene/squalene synthase family protein [Frankia nepalensis]MBL7626554.1 phytoene/squalene synthase family protein [Frankia nepalensis]